MPSSLSPATRGCLTAIGLVVLALVAALPKKVPAQEREPPTPDLRSSASRPTDGTIPGRSQADRSKPSIPGTAVPPATRSADPPVTGGKSPRRATGSQGEMMSGPDMPNDGMPQAPIGGAEWLTAAGAAYALKRLREGNGNEEGTEDGA